MFRTRFRRNYGSVSEKLSQGHPRYNSNSVVSGAQLCNFPDAARAFALLVCLERPLAS